MDEEEQFNQAFGEHTGISTRCRDEINFLKNNERINDDDILIVDREDADIFTDLAWELLGLYIANNTHLEYLDFDGDDLTDEKMALLFRRLVRSESLTDLDLNCNSFGVEGVRCMVPFIQNSPKLDSIKFSSNDNFNSECFDLVMSALDGKPIKELLHFGGCNITDVSALNVYNIPNLLKLSLSGSIIL